METRNSKMTSGRKVLLICILVLTITTPAFSQTPTTLVIPLFNLELIASVLAVVALAAFMFIAMIRYKNKENKELKDTRNDRTRSQSHHHTHGHRRHTNMGHFKY